MVPNLTCTLLLRCSSVPEGARITVRTSANWGAGGGVLAHRLTAVGLPGSDTRRVLVLEAGSYLFPTHVGNLPRREATGSGTAKGIWELWYDYRVLRWSDPTSYPAVAVTQGLNL